MNLINFPKDHFFRRKRKVDIKPFYKIYRLIIQNAPKKIQNPFLNREVEKVTEVRNPLFENKSQKLVLKAYSFYLHFAIDKRKLREIHLRILKNRHRNERFTVEELYVGLECTLFLKKKSS